jgi:hypothetical protein
MKEFLLVFRRELTQTEPQLSPEKYQALAKQWQDWIGGLAAQNKLSATGKRMSTEGKVVRNNKTVTNGPFVEIKEGIAGYLFVNANDIDEAVEIAKDCPIIEMGGNVELRPIVAESY